MARPGVETSVILDAAADLVAARGFAGVRMDAVAKRAGAAKGVLYLRFDDKDALLVALLRREIVRTAHRTARLAEADPRGGLLSRVFVHAVTAMHDNAVVLHAYRDEPGLLARLVGEGDPERFRRRAVLGAHFIRALQEEGMIAGDVDPETLAATLAVWNMGMALSAPHPDPARLVHGMAELLHRAVDADVADTTPGTRCLARFVDGLAAELGA